MPVIEKLHQESQDAEKGAFIEGHLFGFISMIIPCFNRSIPVIVFSDVERKMVFVNSVRTKTFLKPEDKFFKR